MFLGIVGRSAALANAIYHATGQRLLDLQLRIDSLITGLRTRRYGKRAQQSAIPSHLGASGLGSLEPRPHFRSLQIGPWIKKRLRGFRRLRDRQNRKAQRCEPIHSFLNLPLLR
jgi:hypothetical protein